MILRQLLNLPLMEKFKKKSADYRMALVKVVQYCKAEMPEELVCNIFFTMLAIQELLYLPDVHRTSQSILKLYVNVFLHAMHIKEMVGLQTKVITTEKLYGKYYHALIAHSADQYRIVSGRCANAEKEEATFSKIKSITNNTSNKWPDHVIKKLFH